MQANCKKAEVVKKYNEVQKNLTTQIEKVDNILQGKAVAGQSTNFLFGHGFDVSKTNDVILNLQRTIDEREGVLPENKSLFDCLQKLSLDKEVASLKESTSELIAKKISLLKNNANFSDSIREAAITESSLPEMKEEIDKDSIEAQRKKTSLEDSLVKQQSRTLKEQNSGKREILEYENSLTRFKIELLNKKIETNDNLEEKIKQFEDLSSQLKTFSSAGNIENTSKLKDNFAKVESIWLSLSRENYFDLFLTSESLQLQKVPTLLNKSDFSQDLSSTTKLHEELVELRKDIIKNYTQKKEQELRLLNSLVANSSSIRESYYEELGAAYFFTSLTELKLFEKIKNEVLSAPYRVVSYFYSKYLYVREQVSLGREGYVRILTNLLLLCFYVAGFYILKYAFSRLNTWVDQGLEYLFRKKKRSFIVMKSFMLWSKIKESFQPILWLIVLCLIQNANYLSDFSLLVKIGQVYLGAKIIKSIVTMFLGSVSRLDSANFQEFKRKSNETSTKFSNIFLFYFFTMIFLEATVGRVYLYSILNYCVILYSLYHFLVESSRWEREFRRYSERMFSGVIVEKFFTLLNYTPQRLRATLLFAFILIFMVFDIFASFTENFEISKKVSANLFKKQIENVEAGDGADSNIPEAYKEQFSLKSISSDQEYVANEQNLEEKIVDEVVEWMDDTSDEHSLVVYGDKGVGKTTLLKKVSSLLVEKSQVDVKYVKMPSKILLKDEINDFMKTIFPDVEYGEDFSIYDIDKTLEHKTIIIIDECQNVFLSKTGGFDAYYELINIINLNTQNIFWLVSFNKYSWLYLDRAFGRNQFFRNVFELGGWTDAKIKELIMKRHEKSEYKLSYDLLISATRSQDEIDKYASVESKFFKLLWELSRGNPRTALHLWLTALSRRSKKVFNVNIPKEFELEGLEKVPDELLFVISHILKHENLSSLEIEETTNLQKGLVRNAIKLALEKGYVFKDDRHRYMIEITKQYGLIKFLRLKNFIYGN